MTQVTYASKEFYEMLKDFDNMKISRGRYDKEDKELWSKRSFLSRWEYK